MRKHAFGIWENTDADQLISAFVFSKYLVYSAIPLHFKPLAVFYGCIARFVSDLVGNPEDRFSRYPAHIEMEIQTGSI